MKKLCVLAIGVFVVSCSTETELGQRNQTVLGDGDHCIVDGPCPLQEGDCDHHTECQGALVCVRDVGQRFGFGERTDVCLPNTCRDGILNAGEDQIDCGGTSLCGDCSAAGSAVGDVNFCSLSFKCSSGEGDCDKPSDCRPGLTCGSDNGARFGFAELIDICVPTTCTDGVLNGGEAEIDCGGTSQCGLCNNPDAANGDAGFCTRTFPCDVDGQGDCDGPADCAGAFYCAHDVGDAGFGFSKVTDVCVDPAGPPVAVYDAPLTGVCGVPITFNGSRSFDRDPAGTLVLFDWSFGEGNVDTGVSVTHTFAAGGSFLVTLRVIDNGFQNDIFQRPIMITCAAK